MTWLLLEEIWYSAVLHSRGEWNYMGEGGRGGGGGGGGGGGVGGFF